MLGGGGDGLGGGGAVRQERTSDLCCCFSCFYAGPERAVHTARDGPPGPRQPDPSHREERCVFSLLPVWPSSLTSAAASSLDLDFLQVLISLRPELSATLTVLLGGSPQTVLGGTPLTLPPPFFFISHIGRAM